MTLDQLAEAFDGVAADGKYYFVKQIKRLLQRQPELKDEPGHILFQKIISYHIETLTAERDELRKLYIKRDDDLLDGLSDAPHEHIAEYRYFQQCLSDRIEYLDLDIKQYQDELAKRKSYIAN